MKSKFLKLRLNDFWKGAILTVLFSISSSLIVPDVTIKLLLLNCLSVFVAYLAKNLLTNNKDEILKTDKNY